MSRKTIAVIVGFIIASVAMTIMITQPTLEGVWWYMIGFGTTHLPLYYLPALLGGFVSGYLARQRGWLCGLIVGVLLMTIGLMATSLYFWTLYHTPNIVEMTISSICYSWTRDWWVALAAMISSTVGGLLGQLLAQKWHKRPQKKSDVSQSETS
jgi:hypothetical protein